MSFKDKLYLFTIALIVFAVATVLIADRFASKAAWAIAIISFSAVAAFLLTAQAWNWF
jgi:hypothetical protein